MSVTMQNSINITGDLSLIVPSILTFVTVLVTTFYARKAAKEAKVAVVKVEQVHTLVNSEKTEDRKSRLVLMQSHLALLNRVRGKNGDPVDDGAIKLLEAQIVALMKEITERDAVAVKAGETARTTS